MRQIVQEGLYLCPVMVIETVSFHLYPFMTWKEILNVPFTEKKTMMLDFFKEIKNVLPFFVNVNRFRQLVTVLD